MLHDKRLTARLGYLRSLKAPSDQQRLLLVLAGTLAPTAAMPMSFGTNQGGSDSRARAKGKGASGPYCRSRQGGGL
jgi:hypothetical protein